MPVFFIMALCKINFSAGQYEVDGTISAESGNSFSTDIKVTYGEQYVVFKSGFKRPSPSNLHVNLLLHPSQYPDFGVSLVWDYKRDRNNVSIYASLISTLNLRHK
jgi:hypothetical protein